MILTHTKQKNKTDLEAQFRAEMGKNWLYNCLQDRQKQAFSIDSLRLEEADIEDFLSNLSVDLYFVNPTIGGNYIQLPSTANSNGYTTAFIAPYKANYTISASVDLSLTMNTSSETSGQEYYSQLIVLKNAGQIFWDKDRQHTIELAAQSISIRATKFSLEVSREIALEAGDKINLEVISDINSQYSIGNLSTYAVYGHFSVTETNKYNSTGTESISTYTE